MNGRTQRWCAHGLAAGAAVMGAGLVPLARFIPPPAPAASGVEIRAFYLENATGIRVGMALGAVGIVFLYAFGACLVTQLRRIDSRFAVLCRLQLSLWIAIGVLGELLFVVWVVAAYRPATTNPDITRMLNDFGWALYLFSIPQFSLLLLTLGVLVLSDRRVKPIFPRWFGWATLWVFIAETPMLLMPFFKHGPLAYRGVITLYLPTLAFFLWVGPATWVLVRAVQRAKHDAGDRMDRRLAARTSRVPAANADRRVRSIS